MLRIAVCEDDQAYLAYLIRLLEELFTEENIHGEILLACDSRQEMENFVETGAANVYLLDINLSEGLEGYYIASRIRAIQPLAYIVFITENLGFVFQSFKVRPFDFLPKPVTKNLLANLLIDICRHMQSVSPDDSSQYIDIKSMSTIYHIKRDDIIMIEKIKNKAFVHTTNSTITCNTTLEDFETLLADMQSMVRCHKSYIVNKNYIIERNLSEMKLTLAAGLTCYMSRGYRKRVL